jgi:TonB family protein
MFDRLVESEPAGQVRSRRNYFFLTTLAMSVISLTGVVVSIFADDYSLNASLELTELISPVEMAQVAPEQPQPRQPLQRTQQSSSTQEAIRTDNVRNIAEISDQVPPISTTPSNLVGRPLNVPFKVGNVNIDPGDGSGRGAPDGTATGLNSTTVALTTPADKDEPPPPPVKKVEPTVPKQISLGVINGKAELLPVPGYPATARAVGAQGQVTVEVTIDESGRVISAHASSGHPLLKGAAEDAARRAKFSPTYLSHIPVKVTGVIVYNFNRG